MKYLLRSTEVYRVEDETEAKALIEEAKQDKQYTLIKYLTENREQKSKGEIIDTWKRVTLVKAFNDEKEADVEVKVTYEV